MQTRLTMFAVKHKLPSTSGLVCCTYRPPNTQNCSLNLIFHFIIKVSQLSMSNVLSGSSNSKQTFNCSLCAYARLSVHPHSSPIQRNSPGWPSSREPSCWTTPFWSALTTRARENTRSCGVLKRFCWCFTTAHYQTRPEQG